MIWQENSIQIYDRFLVLSTASRVAENRQIRKNTKAILRREFRSKNKIGQEKFTFNWKLYHSTFFMPRISLFGSFIRIKYKLELDHVIRVAVNKHVFVESKFTYLRVTSTCSQYIVAVNSKLGRTKGKESSHLWKQLLFIQIHLWRKN